MQNQNSNPIYQNLLVQADKVFRHCRQGSYKTRARYKEAFKRFLCFIAEQYRAQSIANISAGHLLQYVRRLQENGMAPSTICTELSAIRFWHDQIPGTRHTLPQNSELSLAKRRRGGVDRTWSAGEYNRMVLRCWQEKREDIAACIILAYHTGLRIHEVVRVDTATARDAVKHNAIIIKGKGGKVRRVPLDDVAVKVLRGYLAKSKPGHKLFVPWDKQTHVFIREIQDFIRGNRNLAEEDGREANMTFHGLRHTRAVRWYAGLAETGRGEVGAKLEVSKRLGHNRAEVTDTYLASLPKKKKPPKGGDGHV